MAWAESWDREDSSRSHANGAFWFLGLAFLTIPLAVELLLGGTLFYYSSFGSSPPKWSGMMIDTFVGLAGPATATVVLMATQHNGMPRHRRIVTAQLAGLAVGVPVMVALLLFIVSASVF